MAPSLPRTRQMIALSTSASSGLTTSKPLGIGLRRGDLQQRHELAGAGQPVLDQAVVAELEQFLGPAGR